MKRTHPPFISIIIPALNEEAYLPLLLSDLSRQTMGDFEVLVADGHSDDSTLTKARSFAKSLPHLTLLESSVRNVSVQRNLGATKSRAKWLLFLDADDRIPLHFLQGLRYQLEAHSPDFFSTYLKPDKTTKKNLAIAKALNLYLEVQKNTSNAGGLGAMLGFNRKVFTKLKGFNSHIPWGEEGDLCYRALMSGYRFKLFKEPTYTYSLRRLDAQGTINLARGVAQLEIARLLHYKLPAEKVTSLYPMDRQIPLS